jgi:hypothetical protein
MKFAKRAFFWGGIYGLLAVTPLYFLRSFMGRLFPPAINHPEFYYGFVGAVVVWHVLFLVVSKDPARYRAVMPVAALEKLVFGAPVLALIVLDRASVLLAPAAVIDLIWGALYLISYWKVGERSVAAAAVPEYVS